MRRDDLCAIKWRALVSTLKDLFFLREEDGMFRNILAH